MRKTRGVLALTIAGVFVAGLSLGTVIQSRGVVNAQGSGTVFELRTYTAPEGKLGDLNKRFRDHTRRIFDKHNMKSIGYWTPQDAPNSQNTLIYILQHANRDAAKKNWAEFQADPEWQKVSAESQVNGRIVSKVESVFMEATDYSAIK
jgi:NIPSNAP protein